MAGQGNGLKIQLVRFELTPTDAELFVKFRKYQDIFKTLVDKGAFDIRSGNFTCHMDADGVLRKVERSDVLYRQ